MPGLWLAHGPEAYRCPKCFIYFCFKCRARVAAREAQFQCADQSCPFYGKLLCAACTVMIPELREVTRVEMEEGKGLFGWLFGPQAKTITETKHVAEHRCCTQCRHPVK